MKAIIRLSNTLNTVFLSNRTNYNYYSKKKTKDPSIGIAYTGSSFYLQSLMSCTKCPIL